MQESIYFYPESISRAFVMFVSPRGPDSDFIYATLILLAFQREAIPHTQKRSLCCLTSDAV